MNWLKPNTIKARSFQTWFCNQCTTKRVKGSRKFMRIKMKIKTIKKIHKKMMMMKMMRNKKSRPKMPDWSSKWVPTNKLRRNFRWLSMRLKTLMMLLLTQIECFKARLKSFDKKITFFWTKLERLPWTSISIWTSWLKFTRQGSSFSKLKTGTTECHLNFKTS